MDKEYLRHIQASPYVSEGVFTKAKTWASNIQPSEDPYTTPQQAQLLSYYNSFKKDLIDLLNNFAEGSASPAQRIQKTIKPDTKTNKKILALVDQLINLYETLSPRAFPSSLSTAQRQYLSRGLQTRPRGDSGQFAKATKHLDKIEPNHLDKIEPNRRQQPTTPVTEGWYQREKAKGTGNPKIIAIQYLDDLRALYNKFIANIIKVLPKVSKDRITREFKRIINNPKLSAEFDKIDKILKPKHVVKPQAQPTGSAAPASTIVPPTTPPPSTPEPPKNDFQLTPNSFAKLVEATLNIITYRIDKDLQSDIYKMKPNKIKVGEDEWVVTGYTLPSTFTSAPVTPHGSGWSPPPPLPEDATDAEKEEYKRKISKYRYTRIENPKTGESKVIENPYSTHKKSKIEKSPTAKSIKKVEPHAEPTLAVTTEAKESPTSPDDPKSSKTPTRKKSSGEDEIEKGKGFLYIFAGLYDKYQTEHALEVTDGVPVEVDLSDENRPLSWLVKVYWRWQKRANIIIVEYMPKPTGDSTQISGNFEQRDLFKFMDDEPNPVSSYHSGFSVAKMLEQVRPEMATAYLNADDKLKSEAEQAFVEFAPYAYAVVQRKGPMERKEFKRLQFYIDNNMYGKIEGQPYYGSVRLLQGIMVIGGHQVTKNKDVSLEEVQAYYYTPHTTDSFDELTEALEECGYWNYYIGIDKYFVEKPIIGNVHPKDTLKKGKAGKETPEDTEDEEDETTPPEETPPTTSPTAPTTTPTPTPTPEAPVSATAPEAPPAAATTPPSAPSGTTKEDDITNHLKELPKDFAVVARSIWKKLKILRMKPNAVPIFIEISKQMLKDHPTDVNAYKNDFANSLVNSLDNLGEKEAAKQLKKSFGLKESNTLSNGLINPFQSSNFI